jgi:hypothetical protein
VTQGLVSKTGLKDSSSCHSFKNNDLQVVTTGSQGWVETWISSWDRFITTRQLLWIRLNFKKSWRKELKLRGFKWKTLKRMKKRWKHFKKLRENRRAAREGIRRRCSLTQLT